MKTIPMKNAIMTLRFDKPNSEKTKPIPVTRASIPTAFIIFTVIPQPSDRVYYRGYKEGVKERSIAVKLQLRFSSEWMERRSFFPRLE